MRNKKKMVILPITFLLLLSFVPICPALEAAGVGAMPTRLHFVNALDANVYTERLVYEVCSRLDIDVTFSLEDSTIGLQGVNAGVFDGICNQTKCAEGKFDQLVCIPVETAVCNFYALTLREDPFVYGTWDDLKGKRVGSLSGQFFGDGGLPADVAAHIEQLSMSLLYQTLRTGDCNVIVMADTSGRTPDQLVLPDDLRVAGLLDTHSCHIVLNKKHTALAEQMATVLEEMEQDGSLARIKAMKPVENRNEKVVLYISSYSSEMEWEQRMAEGIGSVLGQYEGIMFHSIPLNALRNTDDALRETTALESISVDFIHSPPDAVIVSDNEAMEFFLNNYNALLSNEIPVVACGMNSNDQFTSYPNIIGIEESISAAQTVEEMLRLFPATERIFVINDYSLTGQQWTSEIQRQLTPFQDRVQIEYNGDVLFEDLMAQVAALDSHALILSGSFFLDRDDHYFSQIVAQRRLYEASSVPIFGLLDSAQSYGPLGGRYADAVLHGQTAASMMVKMLDIDVYEEMPIADMEKSNRWIFNWSIMQEYGIGRNQLPSGAILLNSRPSLRETDPVLFYTIVVGVIAGAVIILLLAVFSFALKKRNLHLIAAEADLRRSHDEIESAKNHLQTILETAPIAYSLLVDDVVVESNSYYNLHIGSAAGQKNGDKYGVRGSRYTELMEECREKGFVGNISWRVTQANGEKARYLYNIARSEYKGREAIVMWGAEIEQLERQKDALDRAYHDLRGVIESAPLPIVLMYPKEKRFVDANPAMKKLFRVPDAANISDLHWGDEGAFTTRPLNDLIQRAMETGRTIVEDWKFLTFDGEVIEARALLRKIVYGGRDCLLLLLQDLRAERARERMLESAAEKEREVNRLKTHFLMNMSHEIRTPMNAIIGITQLSKPTDEAEKLYGSIRQIGHSTSVLLNIVSNVLDLSLMEDGKMVLKPEEVKLSGLIEDLDAVIAVDMGKKHIERSVHLEGVVHDTLRVDAARLQQVLMILASNAVKFTPEGGKNTLTVKETEGPNNVSTFLFAMQDNGVGIEPEQMGRLFKPFEQGDGSMTRQYGGAGLGLSIAKNIVELMGGKIWVESEAHRGSTFFFSIPAVVRPTDAEDSGEPARAQGAAKEIDFSTLRILVVDDVELNRMVAVEMLGSLGCAIEEVENGRQAVDRVAEAAPGYFDLVLMDLQMPVLDGCSATREIRALDRPDAATLPIVAMTANVMPDDIQMMRAAGMNGHVAKPVFLEQLVEAIKDQLA